MTDNQEFTHRESQFIELLPDELSRSEKRSIIQEALVDLSESEKEVVAQDTYVLAFHLLRGDSMSSYWREDTSQKFQARFDGLPLLQAYMLRFGFPPEEILTLGDDEVIECCRSILQNFPHRFPLAVVRGLVGLDVDDTLVSSFMSSSSTDADVERLAR